MNDENYSSTLISGQAINKVYLLVCVLESWDFPSLSSPRPSPFDGSRAFPCLLRQLEVLSPTLINHQKFAVSERWSHGYRHRTRTRVGGDNASSSFGVGVFLRGGEGVGGCHALRLFQPQPLSFSLLLTLFFYQPRDVSGSERREKEEGGDCKGGKGREVFDERVIFCFWAFGCMAVQAQQQFLDNPQLLCNNSNNSALGWIENRGGSSVDLYYSLQQKQQQQQQQQMTTTTAAAAAAAMARSTLGNQQHTTTGFPCPPSSNKILSVDASYSLALQMDKQKREMEQYLCLHIERLRAALQQQMKGHLVSLMRKLDSKASSLLRQKEEELARSSKKAAELEEFLKRAEAEGQTWQRIARENEALALSLRNTLEQVRDNACLSTAGGMIAAAAALGDAAASCCDSSSSPPGPNGIEKQGEGEEVEATAGQCRGCGSNGSCMLFMPCMHLCACKLCDALLDSCPVCSSVKRCSIEVFFS